MSDKRPIPEPDGTHFDPVLALEQWAQDEVRDHGLVDIKFFPRIPGDPPPDLKKAAAEALRMLTSPGEDVSDQEL